MFLATHIVDNQIRFLELLSESCFNFPSFTDCLKASYLQTNLILCLKEDVYESGSAQISANPPGNPQCCSPKNYKNNTCFRASDTIIHDRLQ